VGKSFLSFKQQRKRQFFIAAEGITLFAAEGSTLFLTICFSRTSAFPAELCIAERQLEFGGVQVYGFSDL
jgi:hypothetical protein